MKPKVEPSSGHDLAELLRLIVAYRISQCIRAAVELRIADHLASGPKAVDELAAATAAHAESLYRVLRLLTGTGIFAEVASRRFALTPLGDGLRSDVPGSPAALARVLLGKSLWEPWCELVESVRTGRSAFAQVHGMGLFDYLERHPDEGRLFDAAMTEGTVRDGIAVAQSYDFSGMTSLVDVGGGQGLLLASLLQTNPHLKGILFDLPEAVARGEATLEKWGVARRCTIVGGSFFDSVPKGADAYILRHIIHDWGNDKACQILRNCRDAATPAGKVLVIERLVTADYRAGLPLLGNDMEMMVTVGGKERTETEFRELFAEAGLRFARVIGPDSPAEHVIIEGEPG